MQTHLRRAVALVATVTVVLAGTPVSAQYFGRNKVQYKELAFRVLETEHFNIYFYPQERAGVEISARLAERAYSRLSRLFQHQLRGRQPLVLYASHPDFEQTNVIQDEIGEGTGGVTEPLRRRIVPPLGGPLADTDHVIAHELVHAFQFDITTGPSTAPRSGITQLPLWFVEGMAEYFSVGPIDPNTAMWVRDAARQEQLPSLDDLDDPKYFPYRWGQAFWAYVGGRWGDDVIQQMLRIAGAAGDVEVAIQKALGLTTKELSDQWHASIRDAYEPVLAATASPDGAARLVVKGDPFASSVNIGPAISPDGRWIAFLSSRSFFSIDLYVADAATGRIARRLTSTATNPHFSSLQFIYSAGAWDAASGRLAIATVSSGRPAIAIFNVETGRLERELPVPAVDEIFHPTWAPDGHAICFTAMTPGLTDLFTYNFETSALRRLTSDAYADLQPAWSPDGRKIAFATDRFSTQLDSLAIGPYRIAMVDPDGRSIEQVPGFDDGQSLNPQWSAGSDALYFVSDRTGIANLYRVALAGGGLTQLTNVATGVSGITGSSPAMSVAARSSVASFSMYEHGTYDIYAVDLAGRGSAPSAGVENAAVLPPSDRRPSAIAALLTDATLGLPEPAAYPETKY
ncbi:MAG: PD40 domain-containing protein, partial [Acidobacteria bacterium]|nr:PD40 domain-containing protein [Acidobacteriota bacterium]